MKNTAKTFLNAKHQTPLTMLTAYDYTMARLMDGAGINGILVGDSLGMVFQGHEHTLPVTLEHMIYHTQAVVRGTKQALVVGDMPFMSYHLSPEQALANAGRLIKEGGAHAVKLEGGESMATTIHKVVSAGIPVMAHIGMTPQSVNTYGGFLVQGKSYEAAQQILRDAHAVQEAGAFSVVLECVPAALAELITNQLSIPTIGIGAGVGCDGQILVYQDMLGIVTGYAGEAGQPKLPKFVKAYANLDTSIQSAFATYIDEVRAGSFPDPSHTFTIDSTVIEQLKSTLPPHTVS